MSTPEITPELCETVINEFVSPTFEACIANGTFGRRDGSLLILQLPEPGQLDEVRASVRPDRAFYENFVIHEQTWSERPTGPNEVVEGTFTLKALQKAFGTFVSGMDYEKLLQTDPEYADAMGLIKYPGGLIRDVTPFNKPKIPDVVAAYSGLWWYHDSMLAGFTLDGIKAELNRRAS